MKIIKGQTAIEFMVIMGFALFFFVSFFAIIQNNLQEEDDEKERMIAQNIIMDVKNEIKIAAEASDGYSRVFTLPYNILGRDYEISIINNMIYLKVEEGTGIAYNTLNVSSSSNPFIKGDNVIKKRGGEIVING